MMNNWWSKFSIYAYKYDFCTILFIMRRNVFLIMFLSLLLKQAWQEFNNIIMNNNYNHYKILLPSNPINGFIIIPFRYLKSTSTLFFFIFSRDEQNNILSLRTSFLKFISLHQELSAAVLGVDIITPLHAEIIRMKLFYKTNVEKNHIWKP